jgi:hypothetical protein
MSAEGPRDPQAAAEGLAESYEINGLEDLLDRLHAIDGDHDPVDLGALLQQIGRRSFGVILLLAGTIVLIPIIGDIPGVPTLAALLVAIPAIQLLLGRGQFWLPDFLLKRSMTRERLEKSLTVARKPARFIDRFTKPRLLVFVGPLGGRIIGATALGIALVMPVLELIPFSANLAGIALLAFGVAMIARDGLFAAISLATAAGVFVLVGYWLLNL